MIAHEFVEYILQIKKEGNEAKIESESHAYDVAALISGQMTIPLFYKLQQYGFDMITLKNHLEALYDSNNHFGLIYFIFILAESAEITVPLTFAEMCANDALIPILSEAIIEDWLDIDYAFNYYDD